MELLSPTFLNPNKFPNVSFLSNSNLKNKGISILIAEPPPLFSVVLESLCNGNFIT